MTGSIKPSPPAAPNGGALAAGQSYGDVQTAIGNTIMSNANEQNPYGQVNYTQTGSQNISVPIFNNQGAFQGMQSIAVPQFNRATTLTPTGQHLLDQQQAIGTSLNDLAYGQTQRLSNVLGQPISASGLPARTDSYGSAPTFQNIGGGPGLAQSGTALADTGNAQRTFADTGSQQRGFADVGGAQRNLAGAGPIQQTLGPNDYAAQRAEVENSIYSRLNPQLDRDRNALETKLVNQGLVRGTEAFNTAMDESNRQANDARMQAVLAGGQEQSRLAGLDLQKGQFANSAEQQNYDQILGRGQFANAGQAQDFGQAAQRAGLFNTAQAADFGQAAQRGAFFNAGQEQDFGQANQRGMFGLQATDQNNQALEQQYQNQTNATQANNQLAQQQYGNSQSAAQFGNENRDRALQESISLRNQPINETSALMAGGQVQVPQFQQYNPGTIANNNLGQNIFQSAALGNQNFQTQQGGTNALLGALGGLGGAGLYGLGRRYG